jgi:hypothetical protein
MFSVAGDWNPKQALLKSIITKQSEFERAIRLVLQMHCLIHSSEMSGGKSGTLEDELWDGMTDRIFSAMPTGRNTTVAWNLWHITRIEDITVNILIADGAQILNAEWLEKMNTRITDTGNAMTAGEINDFSQRLNMPELKKYRIAVGRNTRSIIGKLMTTDLNRRMDARQLKRILAEGAVLEAEASRWLIDFWGRKTVAGLLLMPVTRHQIVHLNDSIKIKKRAAADLRREG